MDISAEEISSHLAFYPSNNSDTFSYDIFKSKEFYDKKLKSEVDTLKIKGVPLDHQILASRFFSPYTPYRKGLVYQGVGTGKTCLSSLIVENFKDTIVNGKKRLPALVLVQNEKMMEKYIEEVAYVCTNNNVYTSILDNRDMREGQTSFFISEKKKFSRISSAVRVYYDIVTAGKFKNYISRLTDEKIKRDYSNRVIIVDEAHHFHINNSKKKSEKFLNKSIDTETYNIYYNFFHNIEDNVIIFLTGTPITDSPESVGSLLNLLLDKKDNIPSSRSRFYNRYFDEDGYLKEENLQELKDIFKKYVSYLRSFTKTVEKNIVGVTKPWTNIIKFYPCGMSKFQYFYAKEAYLSDKTTELGDRRDTVKMNSKFASNFVFPVLDKEGNVIGGEYGKKGFQNNIVSSKNRRIYNYKSKDVLTEVVNNLSTYSCKYAKLVQEIKSNPDKLIFVFDEYLVGGNLLNLSLILERLGFVWAKSVNDISKPDARGRKRFAVISDHRATIKKNIDAFLKSFNKSDNKYGERCQIILGTKTISEGVTIRNVRQAHLLTPYWNENLIDQVLGRVSRYGTHSDLPPDERILSIYRYASLKIFNSEDDDIEYAKGEGYPSNVGFSSQITVDVEIFRISEKKELYNSQIFRLMKESAWDCPLNYKRNVIEEDIDGSRECNYDNCNYVCDGFPEKYIDKEKRVWDYDIPRNAIDHTNYNLYYSSGLENEMIEKIKEIFHVNYTMNYRDIFRELRINKNNEIVLLRSLDRIINNRIPIKNKYGFCSFLNEERDLYYLSNVISTYNSSWDVYYEINPSLDLITELKYIIRYLNLEDDEDNIYNFCSNPKNIENFKNMNNVTAIILMEKLIELSTRMSNDVIDYYLNKLSNYYYETEDFIFHNLYDLEYKGIGYNVSQMKMIPTGNMRVFEKSKGQWGYVPKEKEEQFIEIIKLSDKDKNIWDDNPYGVYGIKSRDGTFKIREKPRNKKAQTKGIVCKTKKKDKIMEIYKKIGYLPPLEEDVEISPNRDQIIRIIRSNSDEFRPFLSELDKMSLDDLQRLIQLNSFPVSKICSILEDWFSENNLLDEDIF